VHLEVDAVFAFSRQPGVPLFLIIVRSKSSDLFISGIFLLTLLR